jgi:hypothetical protein
MAHRKRPQNPNTHTPLRRSKSGGLAQRKTSPQRRAFPASVSVLDHVTDGGGVTVYSSSEFRITR